MALRLSWTSFRQFPAKIIYAKPG